MIWSAFACCKYVVNPLVNFLKLSVNLFLKKDVSSLSVKQLLINYCPISLLRIFGNILERLPYKTLQSHQISQISKQVIHVLTSCYQSYMKFTDHLMYLEILLLLHVREVFLGISKASDKVWHPGLLDKLRQNCITDKLIYSDRFFKR